MDCRLSLKLLNIILFTCVSQEKKLLDISNSQGFIKPLEVLKIQ